MAQPLTREMSGSPRLQGVDEAKAHAFTVLSGHTPTSIVLTVKDLTDESADVTDEVMTGTATANSGVITLPLLSGLTAAHTYRVEVKYNNGDEVWEPYFIVRAEE